MKKLNWNTSWQDRFAAYAIPEPMSGCWLWNGPLRGDGYGRIKINDVAHVAHRVSWELHRGKIPAGAFVCHHCDNPLCVNPDHLFLGSAAENMADKTRKNRQARGKSIRPNALSAKQIAAIRHHSNVPTTALSKQLGISYGIIWNLRHGMAHK